MTFGDWKAVTGPKVEGSWNLHAALPKGLDFFIMLSSVQGILGTGLLAAYNAGNTYQDSLARYRVVQGERAIAIDLGGVTDSGFLAENSRYDTIFKRNKKLSPLQLKELYALLDIACEPGNDTLYESVRSCQCIVGLSQPASWNLDEEPFTMSQPFWGHMHHVPLRGSGQVDSPDASGSTHAVAGRKQTVNLAEQLAAADSIEEVSTIILEALVGRVCSLLGTDSKRMDVNKSMQSHGIDSISAIDLRNWVIKAFDVDMPVFEFLGAGTFVGVAETIASKKGSNTTKALLGYLRQGEGLQSVSDPVDS
jgi:hypothetical protein